MQPQLVGQHRGAAGAVGEQAQLLLLDPVLHFAAGAVQVLVQAPGVGALRRQAGDHEPRVRPLGQVLRLAHHAPDAGPAVQRAVAEVPAAPGRLPGAPGLGPRLAQLRLQRRGQPPVARQTQHVVDVVVLAPAHDRLAAEPRVAAHQDPRLRPARPDVRHDPIQLFHAARRAVHVRRPQPRAQQVPAREDVRRQVAVVPVVAVEEPPLLTTVQSVVRRVQVQPDLGRRLRLGLQEQVHQQPVHRRRIGGDALVAVRGRTVRRAQLQPVQRARTGQRTPPVPRTRPVAARGITPAHQHRQQPVPTQLVVVVQVLVAQRQTVHPLRDQRSNVVLHAVRVAVVREALRQAVQKPQANVGLAQQQSAAVRGDPAAVEPSDHLASAEGVKSQLPECTLCRHGTSPSG